jgi:hypothetical protein
LRTGEGASLKEGKGGLESRQQLEKVKNEPGDKK